MGLRVQNNAASSRPPKRERPGDGKFCLHLHVSYVPINCDHGLDGVVSGLRDMMLSVTVANDPTKVDVLNVADVDNSFYVTAFEDAVAFVHVATGFLIT